MQIESAITNACALLAQCQLSNPPSLRAVVQSLALQDRQQLPCLTCLPALCRKSHLKVAAYAENIGCHKSLQGVLCICVRSSFTKLRKMTGGFSDLQVSVILARAQDGDRDDSHAPAPENHSKDNCMPFEAYTADMHYIRTSNMIRGCRSRSSPPAAIRATLNRLLFRSCSSGFPLPDVVRISKPGQ